MALYYMVHGSVILILTKIQPTVFLTVTAKLLSTNLLSFGIVD